MYLLQTTRNHRLQPSHFSTGMLVWLNVRAAAYIALNPQPVVPIVQVYSQKSTVKQEDHILKHGSYLIDMLETRRFALLVKTKVYSETGRSNVEILLRQILTLIEIIGTVFILFGVGI